MRRTRWLFSKRRESTPSWSPAIRKKPPQHVAAMLGMRGKAVRAADVDIANLSSEAIAGISAFAEVLPDDKLKLIERAQKDFTVAMAGDGVNDLPAVRRADVGMAVETAVDALKGTADIVLLAPGIGVMQTALIEARKIFFRLYNYSVYRISESFRLIITALILGLIIKGFPAHAGADYPSCVPQRHSDHHACLRPREALGPSGRPQAARALHARHALRPRRRRQQRAVVFLHGGRACTRRLPSFRPHSSSS